jgi:hypothetical protein
MQNQIQIPTNQIAIWMDRWCGNSMSEQIRREIDTEILQGVSGGAWDLDGSPWPETEDYLLWLTDEQRDWCVNLGIRFAADLVSDPRGIVFTFESAEHAVQFATTWM